MPARAGKSKGNSAHSGWKLRTYRLSSNSMLHGALKMAKSENSMKPEETLRTAIVDGRKFTLLLMKNVTQRPKVSRVERTKYDWKNINMDRSSSVKRCAVRVRRWLFKRDIPMLTLLYLAAFLAMNVVFAGLWYIEEGKCCNDPTMTYAQVFDFAVQTSSTIGYGGYWPKGKTNNFLVVLLSVLSVVLSTVYAGLLFFKFITPEANFEFSDVITLSNVLGEPCLEVRVGNTDGVANHLINAEASFRINSTQEYRCDDDLSKRQVGQMEQLQLAVSTSHRLDGVWTLRHFINEKSPLYGFRLDEFPATTITHLELSVKAIQVLTKGEVFSQAAYQTQDILVGHKFEDQTVIEPGNTRKGYFDYAKLSSTSPSIVWYPSSADVLDIEDEYSESAI